MKFFLLYTLLFTTYSLSAQTKKVLFEEFTGVQCMMCPKGHHIMDSLLNMYPNVIGVDLHTYTSADAMFFPQIDTIDQVFANGAPTSTTDRTIGPSIWTVWENDMQTRLAVAPKVSVSLNPSWNSSTREISTYISCEILQSLPTGDYRFNLYVVEDSVTGSGSGYDQTSMYDTDPSLPFFGLGDPIVGYVHRHVARALLPNAWGQSGIIASTPTVGQVFSTTINYTLPVAYDEEKVELIAFITKYTASHTGDEVYNAEHAPLIGMSTDITEVAEAGFKAYPNPTNDMLYFNAETSSNITLYSSTGKTIMSFNLDKGINSIDLSSLPKGIYYAKMISNSLNTTEKIVLY